MHVNAHHDSSDLDYPKGKTKTKTTSSQIQTIQKLFSSYDMIE